jgi:lipopolysaccharide transport system permease protein
MKLPSIGLGIATPYVVMLKNRHLITELVSRDLAESYRNSVFSFLWTIIHPLSYIAIYAVVFITLARTNLGNAFTNQIDFGSYMLVGLSVWLTIQQSISRGGSAFLASKNLVQQVVFPIEVLPTRAALSSMMPMLAGLVFSMLYMIVRFGFVSPLAPLVLLCVLWLMIFLIGLNFLLAPLVAYIRDMREIIQLFVVAGVFLVPVTFMPGALPPWFNTIYAFNPLAYFIWTFQDALFYGEFKHPVAWFAAPVLAIATFDLGYRFFQKTRSNLGDVL